VPADKPTLTNRLISNPKQLFLLDGIGGMISAFMLYVVLKDFSGMPPRVLNQLAAIALFCGIYSLSCFAFVKSQWKNFMTFIAVFNGCYCVLTLIIVVIHFTVLEPLGSIYFIGEIAIIAKLAITEFQSVRYHNNKNSGAESDIA
jgi:hypothetical protein